MLVQELSGLLGVPLRDNVRDQVVKCPFHDDRTPSLSINISKGVFMCWGCEKKGTLLTLARFLGGDFDRSDLIVQMNKDLEPEPEPVDFTYKYDDWYPVKITTPEVLTYMRQKKIDWETIEHFGIRHDDRGTLCMPYYNGDKIVALRYRARDGRKWYESGSERAIYNLNEVRGANRVILCEGESDTHSMRSMLQRIRLADCVVGGIAGANSSVEKWELWALDLMWAEEIYIAFDADEAGDKGADKAIEVLAQTCPRVERLRPTKGQDWTDAIINGESISFN